MNKLQIVTFFRRKKSILVFSDLTLTIMKNKCLLRRESSANWLSYQTDGLIHGYFLKLLPFPTFLTVTYWLASAGLLDLILWITLLSTLPGAWKGFKNGCGAKFFRSQNFIAPTLKRLSYHHPKIHHSTSKSGVAIEILVVASKIGEKGVALRAGEKAASYITPLYAPARHLFRIFADFIPLFCFSVNIFLLPLCFLPQSRNYPREKIHHWADLTLNIQQWVEKRGGCW